MRQKERILRVAIQAAEKLGLDIRDKEIIDSILKSSTLEESNNESVVNVKEEKDLKVIVETPVKKKSPGSFSSKKKKDEKIENNTVVKSTVE